MLCTLHILEVNLAQSRSSLDIPRTYVVFNLLGTDDFYHTNTGNFHHCQVLNGELQFEAQDPHALLTLQLVHNRWLPVRHDRVLGLIHIHVSDLVSLCEGNSVAQLPIHAHMEEGSKTHHDTMTVLLTSDTSSPPETQSRPSKPNLPIVKTGRMKNMTHLTANDSRSGIVHLTKKDRMTSLQEYGQQVIRGVALMDALRGILSGLDFIFTITKLVSKVHWVLECTWNVVTVIFKLVKETIDIDNEVAELILKIQRTMHLVQRVDVLSENLEVDNAIVSVVNQIYDTATFIHSYLKHGLLGRMVIQVIKDYGHRVQEHKAKLEAVKSELNTSLNIQNAQNIKDHLGCINRDSENRHGVLDEILTTNHEFQALPPPPYTATHA